MYLLLFLAGWMTAVGPLSAATPTAGVRQVAPQPHTRWGLNQIREPLSGTTVLVQGTPTAVTTNADGTFLLPLAAGPHTLVVDYPGYRSVVLSVVRPDWALVVTLATTLAPQRHR